MSYTGTISVQEGQERRRRILQALSHRPMSSEQIHDEVQPFISLEYTRRDVRWLLEAGMVRKRRVSAKGKGKSAPRVLYVRTRRIHPLPATGEFGWNLPV